jgi:hypothetical protein
MMNASEELNDKYIQLKPKYADTLIVTPRTNVNATEFDLSMEQKIELIDIGRCAIKHELANRGL